MAYFGFYRVPGGPPKDQGPSGKNPLSESGLADELTINFDVVTPESDRGWIDGLPQEAHCTIEREFAESQQGGQGAEAGGASSGDLILYKVALASIDPKWNCERGAKQSWPGVYLELDTQKDVQLKVNLERLVIDNWTLRSAKTGSQVETLHFRAFVVKHANKAGEQLSLSMRDSDGEELA